jgi:transposase InsO family protein
MPKESKRALKNWAHLRFSIVGPLLATPPEKGELAKELEKLASRRYPHPTREGEWVTFAFSTLERWYYQALETDDPVASLSRKVRTDSGQCKAVDSNLLQILKNQYGNFPQWSRQLHSDNLVAYLKEHPELGTAPSYSSVRRVMAAMGWRKKPKPRTDGQRRAAERLQSKEVRSFEAPFVHSLWHLDFHEGSRKVADAKGIWHKPKALCILDDRSRLCCHIQWYLGETAEDLIHGLIQAFQKRRLPRSLLTDNGSAMTAGETENGLLRLGIIHERTLPYSPYCNGKQEVFWGQLEGRLIAMLSNIEHLTLEMLNNYSQAWVEMEYNRSIHSEIAMSPLDRLLNEKTVCRPCPDMQTLRFAFTVEVCRTQRRSDGTLSIDGVRFEVPCRMRHFDRLTVRYRSWDLSMAYLVDPREGQILAEIHPQDKAKNAYRFRRQIDSADTITPPKPDKQESVPPLLRRLLADYAATGLPAAYIPKDEKETADVD